MSFSEVLRPRCASRPCSVRSARGVILWHSPLFGAEAPVDHRAAARSTTPRPRGLRRQRCSRAAAFGACKACSNTCAA